MTARRKSAQPLILAAIAIALAGAARADDNSVPPGNYTYARDVAPILNKNCAACHRPGQIGPMSLLSYEEVRPWVKSIKKAVAERTMPPWHADPAYGKFLNDCRLSDKELATVVGWADQGAPLGNAADLPPAPTFDDSGFMIGKPDQIFMMQEPYTVGDDVEDLYKHFTIPTGLTEDKHLVSLELRAGQPRMVHHILVFILPAGLNPDSLFDGGALMKTTFLTGWAPGTNPLNYRPGYGKTLPAGSSLLFQLHYHKEPGAGTGGIDQSMMAVKYTDKPIEHPTTTAWVMDPTIAIPPGDSNYESVSSFKFIDDGWILGMVPHMHLRGKNFKFEAFYPDGRSETLLYVPKYDFNWQIAYQLAEAKEIPAGTVVKATAHWDNSAANPSNPDPTQTVYFSEATTDEMMIGFMEYAYKKKKKMQAKYGMPEGIGGAFGGVAGFGAPAEPDEKTKAAMERFKERRDAAVSDINETVKERK